MILALLRAWYDKKIIYTDPDDERFLDNLQDFLDAKQKIIRTQLKK